MHWMRDCADRGVYAYALAYVDLGNLVPRVSHLTALWGERGETLVWSGHVLL